MSWMALAAALAVGLTGIGLTIARRTLAIFTVTGVSMIPTYLHGDRVLVRRTGRASRIRRGAVVIARLPRPARSGDQGDPLLVRGLVIKRVAARPGDPVPLAIRDVVAASTGATVPIGPLVLLGAG